MSGQPAHVVCRRKMRWASQVAAEGHMASMVESGMAVDASRLRAYQCGECGQFHIGHTRRTATA